MQFSWLAVALLALVVIVGAVVGIRQNGGTVQRRATVLSFAVLAAAGLVSCIVIPLLGLTSLIPLFALMSFVLPLAVYAAIVSTSNEPVQATQSRSVRTGSMNPAHARVARIEPLMVSFKEDEAAPAVSSRRTRFIAPVEEVVGEGAPSRTSVVKPSQVPETVPTVDSEALRAVQEEQAKQPAQSETMDARAVVVSYPPPLGEVKSKHSKLDDVAETPARETELPAVSAPVEVSVEPAPAPVPVPQPVEPAPAPMPQLAVEPVQQSEPARPTSETCFSKAAALKDKGAHAVAARLFAESAALADDESGRRRARFEELACYVKAGQPDRARTLATELREQSQVMTKVERIKLDAVTRML